MKDKIVRSLKIVLSVFLMYLLFRQIDIREFKSILSGVSKDGIIIVVLAYVLSIFFNAAKWKVLLPNTELSFLIALSFRAQFYSTVLPGQLFGEASKITAWSGRKENITTITASVLFDKITGIIGQIALVAVGIYLSDRTFGINKIWIIIVLILVILGILFSSEKHVSCAISKIIIVLGKLDKKLAEKIMEFYEAWRMFSSEKRILFKSIGYGVINQIVGIVSIWYLSNRMELSVTLIDYCWIIPIMSIILLLPISFAGIGLRDASLASILSLYNVSTGKAMIISLSMLLGQLMAAGVGALYVLGSNFKKSIECCK